MSRSLTRSKPGDGSRHCRRSPKGFPDAPTTSANDSDKESTVTMKKEILPFKMIPVSMRECLHEFTGSELKVFMCLYLHSGKDNTAYPTNELMMRETGLSHNTLQEAKQGLRKKGFSAALFQRKRNDGSLSSMTEKLLLPIPGNRGGIPPEIGDTSAQEPGVGSPQMSGGHEVDTGEADTGNVDTGKPQDQDQESKEVSEMPSLATLATAVSEAGADAQNQNQYGVLEQEEEQHREQDQYGIDGPLTEEEKDVLRALLPTGTNGEYDQTIPYVKCTVAALAPLRVDIPHVLRYNRSHKKASLVIQATKNKCAGERMYDALVKSSKLVNEWLTHANMSCKICKEAGLSYAVKQRPQPVPEKRPFEYRYTTEEEIKAFKEIRGEGFEDGIVNRMMKGYIDDGKEYKPTDRLFVDAAILWSLAHRKDGVAFREFKELVAAAEQIYSRAA
jgi:helix-turn-helix protein